MAFQLRQSNQIAKVGITAEIGTAYAAFNHLVLSNRELSDLILNAADSNFQPNPSEEFRLGFLISSQNNIWVTPENAYLNGLYSETDFTGILDAVRTTV